MRKAHLQRHQIDCKKWPSELSFSIARIHKPLGVKVWNEPLSCRNQESEYKCIYTLSSQETRCAPRCSSLLRITSYSIANRKIQIRQHSCFGHSHLYGNARIDKAENIGPKARQTLNFCCTQKNNMQNTVNMNKNRNEWKEFTKHNNCDLKTRCQILAKCGPSHEIRCCHGM